MKYNYTYVTIKPKNNVLLNAEGTDHRAIISEYGQKGYRFAGYAPVKSGPSGKVVEFDLIFEKEEA